MRPILLVILCLCILISLPSVFSDQTVKTIDIPIGFGNVVPGNTPVFKTINLQLPDRINQTIYAILKLTGDYLNSTSLTDMLNVSGVIGNCSPTVITPNINTYNYHTEIDCSNLLTNYNGGNIGFGFLGNKTVSNIFGVLELTYYNNPFGSLVLSGTEYTPGDPATIFVQLRDSQGLPITNGACYLNIYNPQISGTHSLSLTNAPMLNLASNITGSNDGLYIYDLVAPSTLGVYMLSARCSYNYQLVDPMILTYPAFSSNLGTWTGSTIDSSALDGIFQQCIAVSNTPLTNKTYLYYPFDEGSGTTAIDLSGNSNGTIQGAQYTAGKFSTALHFDGTDAVTVNVPNLLNSLTQGTVMFWAKSDSTLSTGYRSIFTAETTANGCLEIGEEVPTGYNTPILHAYLTPTGSCGSSSTFEGGPNITGYETSWHNYAFTSNTSGVAFYIDGNRINPVFVTGNNNTRFFYNNVSSASTNYYVGAASSSGLEGYIGSIDDLRVINRSLSSSEIQNIMALRQTCDANYTFNMTTISSSNISALNVYWAGVNTLPGGATIINISYWNFNLNSWVTLPNTLALQGGFYNGIPTDEFLTNSITNISGLVSQNTTILRLQAGANGGFTLYNDWFDVRATLASGTVQDIRGNGELHITNMPNAVWGFSPGRNLTYYAPATATVNTTAIAQAVWNNSIRNLTYYPLQLDMTNYSYIVTVVWNATTRNLTYYPPASVDTNAIAIAVWNYSTRNLTFFPVQIDMTNYTLIITNTSQSVWTYATRILTYYNMTDTTNYTLINQGVWSYSTGRNLTYYAPASVDTNAVAIAVWNATTRNLTFYPLQTDLTNYTLIIGNTTQSVWSYVTRNLTFFPTQIDMTNYSNINQGVWSYVTRNLTYYAPASVDTNAVAIAVWNATSRNLTYYPIQIDMTNYTLIIGNTTQSVWNYINRNLTYYPSTDYNGISIAVWNTTSRNLTYYPVQIDMTNYTNINQGVWNYVSRTLTSPSDNYTAIANAVWNVTTRNLTFYPAQTDMTNYALIGTYVWNQTIRNLTFFPTQIDLTNYNQIGVYVWNNSIRNLTYYPPATVDTNAISIAVWNYTTRNLTYYPLQVDMTNYTNINQGVWSYTVRTLTSPPENTSAIALAVWNSGTRNLTYYPLQVDMTNYTLISNLTAANVWSYINRNLTFFPIQTDMTNYTLINNGVSSAVWTYTVRNLTYYAPASVDNNAVAIAVWNASTRNLTFYPVQTDLTNYSLINSGVWAYITRTLTSAPENLSAISAAVWNYTTRNLTFFPTQIDLTNYPQISNYVWNATTRNLTFFPTQIDMTNYTLITQNVWSYISRTLTSPSDNYTSIANAVWNYTSRNLTYYPAQVDMTNYPLIGVYVWNTTGRNLTYYPAQQDLTNYTLIITNTSQAVWVYSTRNLTFYPTQQDLTNYTLISTNVWNFNNRALTNYSETSITNAVWSYSGTITTNILNQIGNILYKAIAPKGEII